MSDKERQMGEALATLWDTFIRSPLGIPRNLVAAGLDRYSGQSYFSCWDGTGDFHGSSDVWLTRQDGVEFLWTVGVLYEQGSTDGELWQQGCAYAYVAATPSIEDGNIALYTIGNVQLPETRLTLEDFPIFAHEIGLLSERCFDDLSYI